MNIPREWLTKNIGCKSPDVSMSMLPAVSIHYHLHSLAVPIYQNDVKFAFHTSLLSANIQPDVLAPHDHLVHETGIYCTYMLILLNDS